MGANIQVAEYFLIVRKWLKGIIYLLIIGGDLKPGSILVSLNSVSFSRLPHPLPLPYTYLITFYHMRD